MVKDDFDPNMKSLQDNWIKECWQNHHHIATMSCSEKKGIRTKNIYLFHDQMNTLFHMDYNVYIVIFIRDARISC